MCLIFAASLEVLVMSLNTVNKESKPLVLKASWPKTTGHKFRGLLDETVWSVQACGKDTEILES